MRLADEPVDLGAAVLARLDAYQADPVGYFVPATSLPGQKHWRRVYRARMVAGLERCRHCRFRPTVGNPLTFDHVIPKSTGTGMAMDNITILCRFCNQQKGTSMWAHLRSLADEERDAPPHRRWSKLPIQEGLAA